MNRHPHRDLQAPPPCRSRVTRVAALLCAVLLALSLARVPAWSFSVDAPNLPEITGNPSDAPTAEESSATPSEDGTSTAASGAPAATGTETPAATPTTTETTAPAAAPAAAPTSSNWPLIILMSVCGIGLVLVGLFFWNRREE